MITLNTNNLSKISSDHGLSQEEISSQAHLLPEYLEKIHARKQGFYHVIDNQEDIDRVKEFAKQVEGMYDDVVILGIGGSALGAICLRRSLTHLFSNAQKSTYPKLHALDNIDPTLIQELLDVISLEKTLFIAVSKSGATPETLSEYFYFRSLTDKAGLDAKKHFAFVTGPEKGLLRKISTEQGIPAFPVQPDVVSRFSVQTAVGFLPAALVGIDIDAFVKGLRDMRDIFLSTNYEKNLPFQLATMQYLLAQKGKNINVTMPYAQKLTRLADWYRQLLAESIGKAKNNKGETVNVGITPVNALGVTDQHSQSQLYNEGPNDKFIMFLKVNDFGVHIPIPNLHPEDEQVNFIKDTSFNEMLNIEMQATSDSYTENNRPNITIELDKINAEHIGQMFMFYQGAIAFLGEYFEVDAFVQPGVELAKIKTKELLLAK